MTLAVGAACSDGAVLLTDSMRFHHVLNLQTGDERETGEIAPGKITQLAKAGVAYIYAGNCTTDVDDFAAHDFQAAVSGLWKEHRRFTDEHPATGWRIEQALKLPEGSERVEALREATACDVLAASLNLGADGPHMALLTSEGETWLGKEGGIVVAGAAAPWWKTEADRWPVPHSLLECQATALTITAAFHGFAYQRLGRTFASLQAEIQANGTAVVPSVAAPYRGVTVSRLGVRRWRVVLPEDEELYVCGLEKPEAPVVVQPATVDRYRLTKAEAKRQRRTTGRGQRIPTPVGGV